MKRNKLSNKEKAALLFLLGFLILSFLGILLSGKIKIPVRIGSVIVVVSVILLVGIGCALQDLVYKASRKK